MSSTFSTVKALGMNVISGNITKYIRKNTLKLKLVTLTVCSLDSTYIIYDFNIMHEVNSKAILLNSPNLTWTLAHVY